MDEYLASITLWRKPTAKDGTCLFRAVSEQLFHTQALHSRLRQVCVRYLNVLQKHHNRPPPKSEWVGHVEILALTDLFKRDFIIYKSIGHPPITVTSKHDKVVVLCLTNGHHYDSVYSRTYIESAAICQSIIYELLYNDVFGVSDPIARGQEMMSRGRMHTDNTLSICTDRAIPTMSPPDQQANMGSSPNDDSWSGQALVTTLSPSQINLDQSSTSIRDCRSSRRSLDAPVRPTPFPYKVAKALAPDIYRNVEYDTWLESKKTSYGYHYRECQHSQTTSTDAPFSTGDKCQVVLDEQEGRTYNAYIQEMSGQSVTVFVEELGERHRVALSRVIPLPQAYNPAGWHKGYKHSPLTVEIDNPFNFRRKKSGKRKDIQMVVATSGRPVGQQASPFNSDQNNRSRSAMGIRMLSNNYSRDSSNNYYNPQDPQLPPLRQPNPYSFRWTRTPKASNFPGLSVVEDSRSPNGEYHLVDHSMPPPPATGAAGDMLIVSPGADGQITDGQCRGVEDDSGEVYPEGNLSPDMNNCVQAQPGGCSGFAPGNGSTTISLPPFCIPSGDVGAAGCNGSGNGNLMPISPPHLTCYPPCVLVPHGDSFCGPINFNTVPSSDPSGTDLPVQDPSTMRFFFNLGLEYYRMSSYMQMTAPSPPYVTYVNGGGQMMYGPANGVMGSPPELVLTPEEESPAGSMVPGMAISNNGQCNMPNPMYYPPPAPQGPPMCMAPPYMQCMPVPQTPSVPAPRQPAGTNTTPVMYTTTQPAPLPVVHAYPPQPQ